MSTMSYDEPQQQTQQHLRQKRLSKPEEIDLYAQQLIEYTARTLQPPPSDHHHHIDDSLGSYITNCLRTTLESDIMIHPTTTTNVDDDYYNDDDVTRIHQSLNVDDITMIPDYESFCELIQEHCQMVVPDDDNSPTTATTHPMAVQVLQKIWRAVVTRRIPSDELLLFHQQTNANSVHSEDDHHHPNLSSPEWDQVVDPDTERSGGTTNHDTTKITTSLSMETPPRNEHFVPSPHPDGRTEMVSPPPHADEHAVVPQPPHDHNDEPSHYDLLHQHEDVDDYIRSNIVNQLLQWYVAQDLSYDAAYQATCLAQNNVILAQYIIASAFTQIPICKHLMNDGKCYRADCTFNHSMEHHTCVFWMKSRGCSKQDSAIDPCRFLHGFSSKLLENIPEPIQIQAAAANHSHANNSSSGSGMITPYQNIRDFYATSTSSSKNAATAATNAGNYHCNNYHSSNTNITTSNAKSFANIASQGYHTQKSFSQSDPLSAAATTKSNSTTATAIQQMLQQLPTMLIPQNLWQAHENRNASAFYISDPIERYHTVSATTSKKHDSHNNNVIDLHYQSIKTFPVVLDVILPEKLSKLPPPSDHTSVTNSGENGIWIVTGTGHHVNTQRTHQKGGSTLEHAVLEYLISNYLLSQQPSNTMTNGNGPYRIYRGRDRNGKGGAILIQKK